MTPQERVKKTILSESNRGSSDFVDIWHRGVKRRAKVEYGDFRQAKKDILDGKEKEDEISFLNVLIEGKIISEGDDITFNSKVYNIAYFTPTVFENIFDVFAKKSTRFASSGQVKVK